MSKDLCISEGLNPRQQGGVVGHTDSGARLPGFYHFPAHPPWASLTCLCLRLCINKWELGRHGVLNNGYKAFRAASSVQEALCPCADVITSLVWSTPDILPQGPCAHCSPAHPSPLHLHGSLFPFTQAFALTSFSQQGLSRQYLKLNCFPYLSPPNWQPTWPVIIHFFPSQEQFSHSSN